MQAVFQLHGLRTNASQAHKIEPMLQAGHPITGVVWARRSTFCVGELDIVPTAKISGGS